MKTGHNEGTKISADVERLARPSRSPGPGARGVRVSGLRRARESCHPRRCILGPWEPGPGRRARNLWGRPGRRRGMQLARGERAGRLLGRCAGRLLGRRGGFFDGWLAGYCKYLVVCGVEPDQATCTASWQAFLPWYPPRVLKDVASGAVVYDPAMASACLATFDNPACTQTWREARDRPDVPSVRRRLHRNVANRQRLLPRRRVRRPRVLPPDPGGLRPGDDLLRGHLCRPAGHDDSFERELSIGERRAVAVRIRLVLRGRPGRHGDLPAAHHDGRGRLRGFSAVCSAALLQARPDERVGRLAPSRRRRGPLATPPPTRGA